MCCIVLHVHVWFQVNCHSLYGEASGSIEARIKNVFNAGTISSMHFWLFWNVCHWINYNYLQLWKPKHYYCNMYWFYCIYIYFDKVSQEILKYPWFRNMVEILVVVYVCYCGMPCCGWHWLPGMFVFSQYLCSMYPALAQYPCIRKGQRKKCRRYRSLNDYLVCWVKPCNKCTC